MHAIPFIYSDDVQLNSSSNSFEPSAERLSSTGAGAGRDTGAEARRDGVDAAGRELPPVRLLIVAVAKRSETPA